MISLDDLLKFQHSIGRNVCVGCFGHRVDECPQCDGRLHSTVVDAEPGRVWLEHCCERCGYDGEEA